MRSNLIFTSITIEPSEDDIRDYAYHLYEQSGCIPGHDIDNWLEAKACIMSNIPTHSTRTRLHRHLQPKRPARAGTPTAYTVPNPESHNLAL